MPTFCLFALIYFQGPPHIGSFDNLHLEQHDPAFRTLQVGVPKGNTHAVVHADGFVWLAIGPSLYRYDGYQALKVFDAGHYIYEVRLFDGWLYVLHEKGLVRCHSGSREVINLPWPSADMRGVLNSFALVNHENIVLGSNFGVFRWDGIQWHVVYNEHCSKVFRDRDGSFWLGVGDNLVHVSEDCKEKGRVLLSSEFKPRPESQSEAFNYRAGVISVSRHKDGELWIGTTNGAGIYNEKLGSFTKLDLPILGGVFYDELVEEMCEDEQGQLWLATRAGLHLVDKGGDSLRYYVETKAEDSLPSSRTRFVDLDNKGSLWVGTDSGLSIQPMLGRHSKTWTIEGMPDVYYARSNTFNGVYFDGEGRLGVCSFGAYIEVDKDMRAIWHTPFPDRLPNTFICTNAFRDSLGRFFLVSPQGLFTLDGGRWGAYFFRDGWLTTTARSVLEDHNGTIWIGTLRNFRKLEVNSEAMSDGPKIGLGSEALLVEPDGRILVFSERFYHISKSKVVPVELELAGRVFDQNHVLRASPLEQDGNILFLTREGLYVWPKSNRLSGSPALEFFPAPIPFHPVGSSHSVPGLPFHTGRMILFHKGRAWIVGEQGLYCLDIGTGRMLHLRKAHGLHTDTPISVQAHQGQIFISGPGGFSSFDPDAVQFPDPNSVKITSVKQGSRPIGFEDVDRLTLARDEDYVNLTFASLDFSAAGDTSLLHYAYAMQPAEQQEEPEWNDLGTENRVSLVGLDPGDYRLRIKGTNSYGEWQKEKTVAVSVPRPLYATTLAFVLYFLLAAGVTAAVMRYRHQRRLALHYAGLDRLKDEFLANTSHELRTPLGGILGIVEGLLDGAAGALNEAQAANLGMVKSSAGRLKNLVNDLLDFSKLKENDLKIHPRAVDLYGAVEVVCALTKPLADDKRLALVNAVPHDLPPLFADENRLQQILHNLIGNAVKFTDTGAVTIAAHVEGEHIQCTVTDTGPGIAPEDQERIWRSFEQADGSLTRVQEGTGLGLTITRRLLELQGGTVHLTSAPGQGSTFRFTLPKAHGAAAPAPAALQEADRRASLTSAPVTPPSAVAASGAVVLVVDDEPINRHVVRNHLTMQGLRVIEAADGPAALELVATEKPDLVLLDVMMPRMSGYEVCRRLRASHARTDLPVIFLTARGRIEDIVAGFEAGGNDYLVKPVLKAELLSRVDIHAQLLHVHRDLEARVTARTQELAVQTAEVQRRRDQLLMREKMVFLAALARGTAHEIQNPLNFINTLAELSHDTLAEMHAWAERFQQHHAEADLSELREMLQELAESLRSTGEHGAHAGKVVGRLMRFGDDDKDPTPTPTDVDALFARAARLARGTHPHPDAAGIAIVDNFDTSQEHAVGHRTVAATQLSRILTLLVANAVDSCLQRAAGDAPYTGVIHLHARAEGDSVHLTVTDNGVGIQPEVRGRIFEPFYTTHRGKDHLGLGLAIAAELTTGALHGSLALDPGHTDGARFLLSFQAPSVPDDTLVDGDGP